MVPHPLGLYHTVADRPARGVCHGHDDDGASTKWVKTCRGCNQLAETINPVEYDVSTGTFFPFMMHFGCVKPHKMHKYSVIVFLLAVKMLERGQTK